MKAVYRFVTGEIVEIEVAQEVYEVLAELDRLEYNNEHKETRRHISLDMAQEDEGMQFADPDSLPASDGITRLQAAVALLPEAQQRLIHAIYINGVSVNAYATQEGLTASAITHRLRTAERKLCKVLSDPQF